MRQIFTLAGVVRPTILVDGTVAGCWNLKSGKLAITPFYPIEEASVQKAARNFWPELRKIEFV